MVIGVMATVKIVAGVVAGVGVEAGVGNGEVRVSHAAILKPSYKYACTGSNQHESRGAPLPS